MNNNLPKMRVWIGTMRDGTEHQFLIENEIATDATAALHWIRDVWCFPVTAMRDQLTVTERNAACEWVRDMQTAMTED